MAIKHTSPSVSVGTTAVSLIADVPDKETRTPGRSIRIENGSSPIFIGGPDVTSSSYGAQVTAGGVLELDLSAGDEPFAATASGTSVVHVLHLGV